MKITKNAQALAGVIKKARELALFNAKDVRVPVEKEPGLTLLVRPSGAATWQFKYRVGERKPTLSFPEDTPFGHVLDEVAKARIAIRSGRDPQGEKVAARQVAIVGGLTLTTLIERRLVPGVLVKGKALKPATLADYASKLARHAIPVLGSRPIKSITVDDVESLLEAVAKASGGRSAELCKHALGSVFTFAVQEKLLTVNPARGQKVYGKSQKRTRVPVLDELVQLWRAMDTGIVEPQTRLALRLLFLTGQRRKDIAEAARANVVNGRWLIPDPKNRDPQLVPLSAAANAVMAEAMSLKVHPIHVFATTDIVDPHWLTTAMLRLRNQTGCSEVTLHDLRRAITTSLAELGVPRQTVDALLSHKDGSVTEGSYDMAKRLPAFHAALELWASILGEALGDDFGLPFDTATLVRRREAMRDNYGLLFGAG